MVELEVLPSEVMGSGTELASKGASQPGDDVRGLLAQHGNPHERVGYRVNVGVLELKFRRFSQQIAHEADAFAGAQVVQGRKTLEMVHMGAITADDDLGPGRDISDRVGHPPQLVEVDHHGSETNVVVAFLEFPKEVFERGVLEDRAGRRNVPGNGMQTEGGQVVAIGENTLRAGKPEMKNFRHHPVVIQRPMLAVGFISSGEKYARHSIPL